MLRNDAHEALGGRVERLAPAGAPACDHRMKQAPFEPERLAERGALGAQPAEIRRMRGIAFDRSVAEPVWPRDHAAADPAIGASRAHWRDGRLGSLRIHGSI